MLLIPGFSLQYGPRVLSNALLAVPNALLPVLIVRSGLGTKFSPVYLQQDAPLPVRYYAFFEGWLLLSLPPGCLGNTPLLRHST